MTGASSQAGLASFRGSQYPPVSQLAQPVETREVKYAIDSGWLVEVVNRHTCGTDEGGYYGAHEPGCGSVPVQRLDDLPGWPGEPQPVETRVEWGVQWSIDGIGSGVDAMDEEVARACLPVYHQSGSGTLVSRTVTVGPWVEVSS